MKHMLLIVLLALSLSCKSDDYKKNIEDTLISSKLSDSIVSQIRYTEFVLAPDARPLTTNWNAYQTFDAIVERLKLGDLTDLTENGDLVDTQFKELYENIPEKLNTAPINARLKAFETHLLKFKNSVLLRIDSDSILKLELKNVLTAHNNLTFQINKTMERSSQQLFKN